MAADDFVGEWGAFHTVFKASSKPYKGRRRRPGEIHNETFFVMERIDDTHVKVHRKGNPNEYAEADTPMTVPPTINFTLTEEVDQERDKVRITTTYSAILLIPVRRRIPKRPRRTLTALYRRQIGVAQATDADDELGSWTGNQPPPLITEEVFEPPEWFVIKSNELKGETQSRKDDNDKKN